MLQKIKNWSIRWLFSTNYRDIGTLYIFFFFFVVYLIIYDFVFILNVYNSYNDHLPFFTKYLIECFFQYFFIFYLILNKNDFNKVFYKSLTLLLFWFICPFVIHKIYLIFDPPVHEFLLYSPKILDICVKLAQNSDQLDQLAVIINLVKRHQLIYIIKRSVFFTLILILMFFKKKYYFF